MKIRQIIFRIFFQFAQQQQGQTQSLPGHPQGGHNQSFQQQEFLRQQQEYK